MTIAQQLKVKDFPFIIEDSKGNQIYYENSDGTITDNRPKVTLTLDEVAAKFGISVDKLQIKK